jgi:hypothetical protein
MRAALIVGLVTLSLGGCEATRSAFGAINVFAERASAENVIADESRSSRDDVRALPSGLGGDSANRNHLPETLQPANPM